jgi:hypothetical protein
VPAPKTSEHQPKTSLSVFIEAELLPGRSKLDGEESSDARALMRFPAFRAQVDAVVNLLALSAGDKEKEEQ